MRILRMHGFRAVPLDVLASRLLSQTEELSNQDLDDSDLRLEMQGLVEEIDWNMMLDGTELRAAIMEDFTTRVASYVGAQSSRKRPRARTEEPPCQSMSASDTDHAPPPALRSLGSDEEVDEPVFRSAATAPAAAAAAPTATADTRCRLGEVALPPRRHVASLPPPLRAAAMAQLVAIARDTLRQRREGGAAAGAAAGVSSLADELEDLRQWIRFHCGSRP